MRLEMFYLFKKRFNYSEDRHKQMRPTENKPKMSISTFISSIALKVNDINTPIKRHRL